MKKREHYERRMRRLLGASPEASAKMKEAAGSQIWWARCWNCRKPVSMVRHELEHSNCPHCGVNLWERT